MILNCCNPWSRLWVAPLFHFTSEWMPYTDWRLHERLAGIQFSLRPNYLEAICSSQQMTCADANQNWAEHLHPACDWISNHARCVRECSPNISSGHRDSHRCAIRYGIGFSNPVFMFFDLSSSTVKVTPAYKNANCILLSNPFDRTFASSVMIGLRHWIRGNIKIHVKANHK